MSQFTIVGIGEALFDIFPDGRRLLGGAPFNFAVQAHRIASRFGGRGLPITRVGTDELGLEFLNALPVPGEGVQTDVSHPTGTVKVTIKGGEPQYKIAQHVAWDFIEFQRIPCEAVCFGTLAQRAHQSRVSIQDVVNATNPGTLRLFDINLRQHFWNREVIQASLELATAVKLNAEEMRVIAEMFSLESPADLLGKFSLDAAILTRAELGTAIYTPAGVFEGTPVHFPPAEHADAVGAGDACAAAVAVGLVCKWPLAQVVTLANRVGAYVASCPGALPVLPDEIFNGIG